MCVNKAISIALLSKEGFSEGTAEREMRLFGTENVFYIAED